jgi:hypothetical protein
LISEVEALRSIDSEISEREGLDVYKSILNENNKNKKKQKNDLKMSLIEKIFHKIDSEGIDSLTYDEAEQILQKIKPRLNRKFRNGDFKNILKNLDKNNLGFIRIKDFRNSFKFLL